MEAPPPLFGWVFIGREAGEFERIAEAYWVRGTPLAVQQIKVELRALLRGDNEAGLHALAVLSGHPAPPTPPPAEPTMARLRALLTSDATLRITQLVVIDGRISAEHFETAPRGFTCFTL